MSTIPISPADIMDAAAVKQFLDGVPVDELAAATRLAEEQHGRAADPGWVKAWGELTDRARRRAVITALSYLRAAGSIGVPDPGEFARLRGIEQRAREVAAAQPDGSGDLDVVDAVTQEARYILGSGAR